MRITSLVPVIGLTLALAACGTTPTTTAPAAQGELAPLYTSGDTIPGRYIVALRDGSVITSAPNAVSAQGVSSLGVTAQAARSLVGALGLSATDADVHGIYTSAFTGFAATLSEKAVAQLRRDPRVEYVEQDQVVSLRPPAGDVSAQATQSGATWGLDRVDQRALPLNGSYTYNRTGSGVKAYIVDTGLRSSHSQFTGRVAAGASAINDGRGTSDCNGHGTHVAGTVGGSTYGVAKGVTLIPVRVLDCNGSGSISGIISGLDWIRQNRSGPAVANMSLGGGASSSLDTAVNNLWNSGVTVVVAAGNENQNACNVSPARASGVITVASSTSSDARSSFSNWGSCVELFAPGSSIKSAWYTNDTATNTISGTSMASPHVAGAAALYLQGNPGASPATVRSAIISQTTQGVISGENGSPDRLLYTPGL
ncbi:S8 family peptidase [Deinococcus pimensis]|uniref:S8 family peptidase n=1 Tax=Deinococcus pimensis TaxID=309888 RepID=UPI00048A2021|nr:S8 family peptidase [Deinococcus pimensis]